MKKVKKDNSKFLILFTSLIVSTFGLNGVKATSLSSVTADGPSVVSSEPAPTQEKDSIDVEAATTTVSTNMLNVDTAIITKPKVKTMIGKNNEISAQFSDIPETDEKIFAVLVDEVAGGVVDSKFLDSNNKVTFSNIGKFLRIPGIHLYKQGENDPDFLLRKENFIASTSYLMPYIKKTRRSQAADGSRSLIAYKGDGTTYEGVPDAKLFATTFKDVYSVALEEDTLSKIESKSGLGAKDILAAIIAEDENGNTLDVRQWVSTDYSETTGTDKKLCRFEFAVPAGTKNVQVHLYKDALMEGNFLCKFKYKVKEVGESTSNVLVPSISSSTSEETVTLGD